MERPSIVCPKNISLPVKHINNDNQSNFISSTSEQDQQGYMYITYRRYLQSCRQVNSFLRCVSKGKVL